jgi:hypothetical protein
MNKTISIHQPDFLPWLGFFNKLKRSDIFIIMDTAQTPNKKSTYSNKVMLLFQREPKWTMTLPITKSNSEGLLSIAQTQILNGEHIKYKIMKSIRLNYSKHPYFKEVFPYVEEWVMYPANCLLDYNLNAIKSISKCIGLDYSKIILASDIGHEFKNTDLTDRVVEMVKSLKGDIYLSGDASKSYLDQNKFGFNNIKLIFQEYNCKEYPQKDMNEFIKGLSIIDAMMNVGFSGVAKIV